MSGVLVDQAGPKDSIVTTTQLQPDLELEGGPKDVSAQRNESRVQTRSGSQTDLWKPRRVHQWKSPLLMLTFFVIGLCMSIGHCTFYPMLDGVIVGDSQNQERNIRQAASLFAKLPLLWSTGQFLSQQSTN